VQGPALPAAARACGAAIPNRMLQKSASTKKVEVKVKVERRSDLFHLSLSLSLNLPIT